MDLQELRSFIAVAENGSFLGASRTLGVSRTTLRRQVASLEARAGVPLLENVRHGVAPTEAGQVLVHQGRSMMQEATALLASIREVGHAPSGTLHIVLPVGLPPHVLAPLFSVLRDGYPHLRFHVRFSNDPLSETLSDIDIAVHFGQDPPKGNWISRIVLRIREQLVAGRDYLARRGVPRTLDELRSHDLLAWQAPGEDARVWRTTKAVPFTVEPVLIATDIHFLHECAIAGQGIAYVPHAMFTDPRLPPDILVPVLPDLVGQELPVRLSVPAALAQIPKIKMVIERALGFVGDL